MKEKKDLKNENKQKTLKHLKYCIQILYINYMSVWSMFPWLNHVQIMSTTS